MLQIVWDGFLEPADDNPLSLWELLNRDEKLSDKKQVHLQAHGLTPHRDSSLPHTPIFHQTAVVFARLEGQLDKIFYMVKVNPGFNYQVQQRVND